MLPIVFEWHWEIGRLIFMGLFYAALGLVSLAVVFAALKTFIDMQNPPQSHH